MLRQLLLEWRQKRPWNPPWWVALPAVLGLTDLTVTLLGQSEAYWAGDYHEVTEANPLGWLALQIHPGVFLGGGLVWVGCLTAFILWAPRRWSLTGCLVLIAGHTIGTCSWLPRIFSLGILMAVGLVALVVLLALPTWFAWRRAWNSDGAPGPEAPGLLRTGDSLNPVATSSPEIQ